MGQGHHQRLPLLELDLLGAQDLARLVGVVGHDRDHALIEDGQASDRLQVHVLRPQRLRDLGEGPWVVPEDE